jgi:CRP-like cAMP-binding protein
VTERLALLEGFEKVPLSKEEKAIKLGENKWPLGLGLDVVQITNFAEYMIPYQGKAGAVIFRKGDIESFMCLINSGGVDIYPTEAKKTYELIASLGPENTIGEMALIDGEPRSAYAFAKGPTMLFVMTKSNFLRLEEDHPDIWGKLVFRIAKLMSDRLRKANQVLEQMKNSQTQAQLSRIKF